MSKTIAVGSYQELKGEIVRVLLEGHERARQAVEQERVKAYWEVGRILDNRLPAERESGYGTRVMAKLAADLEMEPRRLYNMVEVFRAFEKLNPNSILTFTHYLHLSRVDDQAERVNLAEKCEAEGWSVRELKVVLGIGEGGNGSGGGVAQLPEKEAPEGEGPPRLTAKKGRLFTYRVLPPGSSESEIKLDLGFRVRLSLTQSSAGGPSSGKSAAGKDPATAVERNEPGTAVEGAEAGTAGGIDVGTIVECLEDPKGDLEYGGTHYRLVEDNKPRTKLYTYAATVLSIIDGDTLWVEIDCGFGVSIEEKLRLRGINTPELSTDEGVVARLFVCEQVKVGSTIVLTTSRSDLYDRYVADVFYLQGEERSDIILGKGVYLNRELLADGFATRFDDGGR